MENYENKIMELLAGETPKEKYESLLEIIDMAKDTAIRRHGTTAEFQKSVKSETFISIPNKVTKQHF